MGADDENSLVGALIANRFSVAGEIGSGSFGVVYLAHDTAERKNVALKTLKPAALSIPDLVDRIYREADVCMKLDHPHTARMLGRGELDPGLGVEDRQGRTVPYMVFELVRGMPLGDLLEMRGSLTLEETVHVLSHVLDSLHAAHHMGVVHRDLKPNNILIQAPESTWRRPVVAPRMAETLGIPDFDDPIWQDVTSLTPKVVDFGLAKLLALGDRKVRKLTQAGMLAGTAQYMSPEQVLTADDVDYRADIYAVGMLIPRLLTGRTPFDGKSSVAVAMAQVQQPLPALPVPWTDHPIAEVYARGAKKARGERYQSAAEMAWALRCVDDPKLAAKRPPKFEIPPDTSAEDKGKSSSILKRLFGR